MTAILDSGYGELIKWEEFWGLVGGHEMGLIGLVLRLRGRLQHAWTGVFGGVRRAMVRVRDRPGLMPPVVVSPPLPAAKIMVQGSAIRSIAEFMRSDESVSSLSGARPRQTVLGVILISETVKMIILLPAAFPFCVLLPGSFFLPLQWDQQKRPNRDIKGVLGWRSAWQNRAGAG